jgi:hypothetical protein
MSFDAELHVECYMTNPPKPLGFGIIVEGKVVATLTLEQVREALHRYEELQRNLMGARETAQNEPSASAWYMDERAQAILDKWAKKTNNGEPQS